MASRAGFPEASRVGFIASRVGCQPTWPSPPRVGSVPASRLHLVRHGEVANPEGILYGRLPGYSLSSLGERMAILTAEHLSGEGRPIRRVFASPLERAVESAYPIATAYGLETEVREGLLEASSHLEGGRYQMNLGILAKPAAWRYLVNPIRPSWGEPFRDVSVRVLAEMDAAWESVDDGDVALVTHQLPIWMAHRAVAGKPLFHDPRRRRCALSSVTSFEKTDGTWREVEYFDPGPLLGARAADDGAV
jgi:broad specificity phosphatase PhoE